MIVTSAGKLPNLKAAKVMSFDLETSDRDLMELGPGVRRDGFALGIAIGVEDRKTWYIPIAHDTGKNLPPERAWAWLADQMNAAPDRPVLGANIGYDLDYGLENGLPMPNTIRDVLLGARLLNMQGKYPSLDEALQIHLGMSKTGDDLWIWLSQHRGKGNPTRKAQIGYLREAPGDVVAPYAEGDVALLPELMDAMEPKLREREAWEWFKVECELLPYLLLMRRRGIRVDVETAERLANRLGDEYTSLLEEFGQLAYPDLWDKLSGAEKAEHLEDVNVNSGGKLEPLYAKMGITLPRTATGQPSVTKDWLAEQNDDLSKMLKQLRGLSKISGTFVESYILKHQVNGRIHPELNQLFPRTLRMSGRNPNEQNIPKRDEVLAPIVRGLFLPEEGEDWGRLDYDQQEYRLMVNFSRGRGASEAKEAYRLDPKTNFHKLVHSWLPNIESYSTIKNCNFLKVYRGGRARFAQTLGIPKVESDEIFDMYDQRLPFVKTTGQAAERTARDQGYVQLILMGMRMYFDHWAIDDWTLRNADFSATELAKTYEDKADAEAAAKVLIERLADEGKVDGSHRPKIQKADLYKALNKLIQPSGAQLMKYGMVLLSRSGAHRVLGPALVSVHDELGLSVPRTLEGRQAFAEAAHCMIDAGTTDRMRVPLIMGAEIGPDWGHLEPIPDLDAWAAGKRTFKKAKK
jgi:DNA polymerase I-like protein with 3'-5' exonuclease and polymerase domains